MRVWRAAARRRRCTSGSTARRRSTPARRVTDAVAAFYVEDILRGAPPPANALSGRIAFKTGTSYGFRDALAIGFDKQTTIAVWVGRPDNGPTPGLIGRETAAPILFDAFARLGREIETGRRPGACCASRAPRNCRRRCAICARTRPRRSARPRARR